MLGICIHGSKEITPNLQWQHPVKWKPCRNALSHAGELKDDMKAEDWQVSWPCATYANLGGPGQIAAFCGGFAALDALTFLQKIPANSNARQRGHDLLQRFAAITASVLLQREKIFPSMELLHVLSLMKCSRPFAAAWASATVAVHFAAICSGGCPFCSGAARHLQR